MDGSYAQPKGFVTAIGVPWGKLYRHAFLQEHGLQFDAALPRMQDNLFNMQAFQLAHEIVYVDYAGYYYRMGGLSARTYKNNARVYTIRPLTSVPDSCVSTISMAMRRCFGLGTRSR